MRTQGIYEIRHVASGRVYVGSAVDIERRWRSHQHDLRRGRHHAKRLQAAWTQDGAATFIFGILEVVQNKHDLLSREQRWIDELNAAYSTVGFNCSQVAGSPLGIIRSKATRAKVAAAQVGRITSAETRAKMSAALKGHKTTAETRAKIGAGNKGLKRSAELLARLSIIRKGRSLTAEHRAKLSAALKGRQPTKEHRAALSAAASVRTEAHKAALSAAAFTRQARERAALLHSSQPLDQGAASSVLPQHARPLSATQASLSFD
jgi:group I intron endonuclease